MAKTEMARARVEPELKREAEETFSALGLSATEAITLFYKQVALHRGLPFAVRVPNAATVEAIRPARAGEGVAEYASLDALAKEMKIRATASIRTGTPSDLSANAAGGER